MTTTITSMEAMLRARYGGGKFAAELDELFAKEAKRRAAVAAMNPAELREEVARLEGRFESMRMALQTALSLIRPGYNDIYLQLEKFTRQDP